MPRFRKKPVEIEAMQWDGSEEVQAQIVSWPWKVGDSPGRIQGWFDGGGYHLVVYTLEGAMRVNPGDWIIRGVQGEFYPCKPDIFEATYEPVEGDAEPAAAEGEHG